MMHGSRVGRVEACRGCGAALSCLVERHQSAAQSKGVRGSLPSSAMSWEPANRLPNAQKEKIGGLASVLLPLDNRTFADERRVRSGRDEPNSRGKTSPVRTLPLLGQKTTSFID